MGKAYSMFGGNHGKYIVMDTYSGIVEQNFDEGYTVLRVWVEVGTNAGLFISSPNRSLFVTVNGDTEVSKVQVAVPDHGRTTIFIKEYKLLHKVTGAISDTNNIDITIHLGIDEKDVTSAHVTMTELVPPFDYTNKIKMDKTIYNVDELINMQITDGHYQNSRHVVELQSLNADSRYTLFNSTSSGTNTPSTNLQLPIPNRIVIKNNNYISFDANLILNTYTEQNEFVGNNKAVITITVPDTEENKPKIIEEINELNPILRALIPKGHFVAGRSEYQLDISQTTFSYGATLDHITIRDENGNINDKVRYISDSKTLDIVDPTIESFNLDVTDSRGFKSIKTIPITIHPYTVPSILLKADHGDNDKIVFTYSSKVSSIVIDNKEYIKPSMQIDVQESVSGTTVKESIVIPAGRELLNQAKISDGTYNPGNTYNISWQFTDGITSIPKGIVHLTSLKNITFTYDSHNRFAVGKYTSDALPDGSIESTGGYYLNGKNILTDLQNASLDNITKIVNDAVSTAVNKAMEDIKNQNEPQLFTFNTGSGVRIGNVVYLRFEYYHNAPGRRADLGILPEGCRPQQDTTATGSLWTTGKGDSIPVFIGHDGVMYIYAVQQRLLRCQLSFNILL